MYYIYVIQNPLGRIYIGQTNNLEHRLTRHNNPVGKKKSYTKLNKGPWNLVYQEVRESRQEAIIREKYLKSHVGRDWLRSKLSLGR